MRKQKKQSREGELWRRYRALQWTGAVLIWMALIFVFSDQPGTGLTSTVWVWLRRKAAHIGEFLILTVLMERMFAWWFNLFAIQRKSRRVVELKRNAFSWTILAVFVYAISDEIHQLSVPLRGGHITDVLFDSVGIFFGLFLTRLLVPYRRKRKRLKGRHLLVAKTETPVA